MSLRWQLEMFPDAKFVITFNDDGLFVPDNKVMETAQKIIDEKKDVVVSQFLIIDAIRVLIKRKMINHRDVVFAYNDEIIPIEENGRLNDWPDGFGDIHDNLLIELLTIG